MIRVVTALAVSALAVAASAADLTITFQSSDGAVTTHERILMANPDFGTKTTYGDADKKVIETTVGRVIFSEIWPTELGFPNRVVGKGQIGELIWHCYNPRPAQAQPGPDAR